MKCPYCSFPWEEYLASSEEELPIAPILCGECGEVALCIYGNARKPSDLELESLKKSPAYKLIVESAGKLLIKASSLIEEAKAHFSRGDPLLAQARQLLKACRILGEENLPKVDQRPTKSDKFGEYYISFTSNIERQSLTAVRIRLDLVEISNEDLDKPIALGLTEDPLFPKLKQFVLANATQRFELYEEPKRRGK